ncbi:agmatinase [bacterium]|nr:agmatinase [bacterium]
MNDTRLKLLGIPFDGNSSYMRGPAEAPDKIRKALHIDSSNMWSETGIDLGTTKCINDLGNLEFDKEQDHWQMISNRISLELNDKHPLICLGGDHSITYPIIRGFSEKYPALSILHFDAHPDLYNDLDANAHSHASPFARIMEQQLTGRLVQVGIRGMNGHQREQAERFNVEVHEMRDWNGPFTLKFDTPLYITFDMDALDPAYAPGVSHHEPGGLTTREAISMINRVEAPSIIGADIVEYNPQRDLNEVTAMTAAKLLKEIAAKMLQ